MAKFQVHASSDVLQFEHGASPGGTRNGNLNGAGAEFGMAGEQGFAATEENCGVAVVKGLDFQDSGGWKIVEEDSTFDFGLNDGVVNVVG